MDSGNRKSIVGGKVVGKKRTRNRRVKIALWVLAGIIILFCIKFGQVALSKAGQSNLLIVPAECTGEQLNDSLTRYFGASYAADVMQLVKISGKDVRACEGAYKVSPNTVALQLAWKIVRNRQSELRLTVNHIRTNEDLANLIASKSKNSPDDVKKALKDNDFLQRHGVNGEQVRVLFLENTYNIYYTWPAEKILETMAVFYDKFWTAKRKEQACELGLSPHEVMILASIVDEETNHCDEKGKVGRLYVNRIREDMKLQADPTVKYAVKDFSLRRITGRHTSVVSPYNTYKNPGLPPGPIRSTSAATVDSILNSQPGNQLYMCAKEDFSGYHNFAITFEEHKLNARRYQEELNRRNIR